MTTNNSPEMSIGEIITELNRETTGDKGKVEAYAKFTRQFQEAEVGLFSVDVTQNMSALAVVLMRDIMARSPDVCQGALATLCVCLHDADIVRSLSEPEGKDILKRLSSCILKSEQKNCCTRALWCLGKQNLPSNVAAKQHDDLLEAMEFAIDKWGGQSVTTEHEVVNTIARLAEQAPKEMAESSARWGKLLFPLICHSAVKVRERAFIVMEATANLLKSRKKELVTAVLPVLKNKVLPEMKKLFAGKQEVFVLKSWSLIVDIFGEELHHGQHINYILQVAEMGFKSPSLDVKLAAFRAWQQLIDNFAINPSILSDPKRIKLIMQVFRLNNAKQEEVALVKMRVWWHFIWLLGNKISAHFDLVAVPFIHFCLGGSKMADHGKGHTPRLLQAGASPVTPNMNLGNPSSQWPVFESLQLHGCEALALFLGTPDAKVDHDFKLDSLRTDIVTGPSFFIKHSVMFISTATEFFTNLGKDVPEALMLHIWQWLVAHFENAIESPVKLDVRDTLHTLLLQFQVLVLSRVVNADVCLKMFEGLCGLPRRLLCSSAYSIPGQEMINSTPALFLTTLLLTPALLQSCGPSSLYQELFVSLLSCDQGTGTLDFLQAAVEILTANLAVSNQSELQEAGLQLWNAVVHKLQEHVAKTNEVNQGDSLEPKFTCCVGTLALLVGRVNHLSQHSLKSLQKSWTDLYKTVNRLAAMVTNAEANVICEELCQKVVERVNVEEAEVVQVDWLVQMCHVMTSNLDFSALGNQSMFGLASVSPRKMVKKRHKPLENLHSLVHLVASLQLRAVQLAAGTVKKPSQVGHQSMMNSLVDIFSTLFTHVASSHLIYNLIGRLAQSIGTLFKESSQKSAAKVYNNPFQQKLEKLWQDITTALQSRYTQLYDSAFLQEMSPLFEATFLHSRRQIKNQALSLWTSTFAKETSLEYPESLKPVLTKVREKSHIQLPGWVTMTTSVVEETPVSQLSQMEASQMPEARIPGMPSPHKIHGSLMNKALSPNVKLSPLRSVGSPKVTTASAKKKVLDFDDDKDFVVIAPPPKKKMVLTAHQKEVLKERKQLPAMYNNLELSQDVSLMAAHFTTDTQMDSSSCHDDTPTPTSQPFSLFGSVIPPSVDTSAQKHTLPKEKGQMKSPVADKDNVVPGTQQKTSESPSLLDESSQSRRRSIRFKDTSNKPETPETEGRTRNTRNKGKATVVAGDSKGKKGGNSKPNLNTEKDKYKHVAKEDNSVVVIDDSEAQDDETQPPDNVKPDTSVASIDLTKASESGESGEVEVESPVEDMEAEYDSVPQNVLGIADLTSFSFSKSSESKSDGSLSVSSAEILDKLSAEKGSCSETSNKKEIDSQQQKDVSSVFDVEKTEVTETASEPLLSWTKKLNQLSQSPKVELSPLRKSLSQDVPKATSPTKSPRRTRKKLTNENETKGALDKWIIRSPSKSLVVSNKLSGDVIVASVMSGTLVEETQSPTKFDKIEKSFKSNLPSIMETPPKNVLEAISASHGNSNRKLFGSQSSTGEEILDMVEDSNMVPGSPDSKSGTARDGTPILKIRKLTKEEIRRYSPSKKNGRDDDVEIKSQEVENSKTEGVVVPAKILDFDPEDSSHEHDDFSEFKPLEATDQSEGFSKALTDTDQALLQMTETKCPEVKVDKDVTGSKESVLVSSPTLFSQEVTDLKPPTEKSDKFEVDSVDTMKDSASPSQQLFSEFTEMSEKSEGASQSQQSVSGGTDESFIVGTTDTLVDEVRTPRQSRKRKQITPKKYSPDDIRSPKRKKLNDSDIKGSGKKSGLRSRGKKEDKKENDKVEKTGVRRKGSNQEKGQLPDDESQSKSIAEKSPSSAVDSSQCMIIEVQKQDTKPGRKSLTLKKDDGKSNKKVGRKPKVNQKEDNEVDEEAQQQVERKLDGTDIISETKDSEESTVEEVVALDADVEMSPEVEKTPDSRSTEGRPERRSTTKHKKEVAQKLKQGRDIVVNDSDSNLDFPESDKCTEADRSRKSVENLEKKIEEHLEKDHKIVIRKKDDDQSTIKSSVQVELVSDSVNGNLKSQAVDSKPNIVVEDINEDKSTITAKQDDENVLSEIKVAPNIKLDGTSDGSDDDLPLISLSSSGRKQVQTDSEKIIGKRKTRQSAVGNESDVTVKAEKKVNTRLRSGFKTKTSPQAKRSVNLAIRRCRKMAEKKTNESATVNVTNDDSDKKVDESEVKSNEPRLKSNESDTTEQIVVSDKKESAVIDLVKETTENVPDTEKEKTLDKFKENVLKSLSLAGQESLDETPRKGYESFKNRAAILVRNSDSKLIVGQRRFEKRKGFARRSILKPSSVGCAPDTDSPKRKDFHPITISRIYSPTASPSASILKKRRLSDDPDIQETNSPPAKQRRVSFAEPLTDLENPLLEPARSESKRAPSPLAAGSVKNTPGSMTAVKLFDDSQLSVGSPVSNTYQSTAESQLNSSEAVFPELEGCSQSVEKILPQLTSSMWSRGLGQLVRARNINTIGDLARLTEVDIDNLPIRAPKVDTVKKVLERFAQTQRGKMGRVGDKVSAGGDNKSADGTPGVTPAEVIDLDKAPTTEAAVPGVTEAAARVNHVADPMDCEAAIDTQEDPTKKGDMYSVDIEKMLASSSNLMDEVNRLSQTAIQSDGQTKSCDLPTSQSNTAPNQLAKETAGPASGKELVEKLGDLARVCQSEGVLGLRTDQLFQAHLHLADIQNTIVNSLRLRCQSPTS